MRVNGVVGVMWFLFHFSKCCPMRVTDLAPEAEPGYKVWLVELWMPCPLPQDWEHVSSKVYSPKHGRW